MGKKSMAWSQFSLMDVDDSIWAIVFNHLMSGHLPKFASSYNPNVTQSHHSPESSAFRNIKALLELQYNYWFGEILERNLHLPWMVSGAIVKISIQLSLKNFLTYF